MNFLARSVANAARSWLANSVEASKSQLTRLCANPGIQGTVLNTTNSYIRNLMQGFMQIRHMYLNINIILIYFLPTS
uniref:40S ribosomal protein S12 n=1 Tax=Apis cerana TaxID=7461 RepID=V9IAQ6_APICE